MKVSCSIALPPEVMAEPFGQPVTVHLKVEDVSLLDAPAVTLAERSTVVHDLEELAAVFELEATPQQGRRYAVRAHVDRSGDGTVAVGDLVTTSHVPLGTEGADGVQVQVPVTTVR